MATRRPKVPRADALGPSSAGRSSGAGRPASETRATGASPRTAAKSTEGAGTKGSGSSSGDVIKAEFGGPRITAKTPTPAGGTKAPAGKKPSVGQQKPTDKASGKPGTKATSDHDLDPVPAKAFSGRMLALAVVMIAITIMLAPTVKIFLEKRAEISALEAEIAGRKAEQAELNKQLSRWQDPNYVKQQARDRINMVMPGETGYWVFGGEEAAGTPGGRTGSGSSANPENLPWVDALWESIRRSATD
ncbi:septum formation initiator family protein [Paenarthrobacter sp. OM7]|uniref:Septum formation initiator family protein n=1 Tax=Paenarthrobacter sp. AMU7 TaxID=3162492 RepID=A0AB39YT53_9MICC|nr:MULTISPECIES: septum formation initiator family protein [Micrococcaceae]QSZ48155.1 septation ring formation regulator EzrA [Arthrobacter sp. D5-1]WGM21820.1 septum formation initiator family protein [Paenarthrobacter sp. OM7]